MRPFRASLALFLCFAALSLGQALAQDKGSLNPAKLPPITNPDDPTIGAKQLFGRAETAAPLAARTIGFYSRGCLAGAQALPVNGETWQVMRLSRNRNWGHPALIAFLERFAAKAPALGWRGLLVGDMSQPRGGPMITGHASHQIGLDADIWLTPMPERQMSRIEREELSATNIVREDWLDVEAARWTPKHLALIKAAAQDSEVERVLVNPAIKKAICRDARGDRSWLAKVRPFYGHNYHMHVRIGCPDGEASCKSQDPVPGGEGCDASLAWWFTDEVLHPKPRPAGKPKPPMTLAQLPGECRQVLLSK